MLAAVFDTKPYDRRYLTAAAEAEGIELRFFDARLRAETAVLAGDASAVCAFVNDELDAACLEALAARGVRHIALRCAGFNNLDLDAARRLGLAVTRVPGYSPHAVAEHTVALLLSLNRQIPRAVQRVKEHNFTLNGLVGFDLHGKTAGILGAGTIGRITARILRGFGMKVLAFDPRPDPVWADDHGVIYAPMDEVLGEADVLSLHLPLTAETHHLLDEAAFAKMKPGAWLINTGRGKLIDSKALISALKSRHLGGVALDVYEEEEGVFFEDLSGEILDDDILSRLLTFPNVIVTSHQAFLTHEALVQIASITCGNLARFGRGEGFLEGTTLT